MPTTVRAAVLREVGGPLSVEPVTLPDPAPGQVRVRLAATGVCHSDLSLSTGVVPHTMPAVLGHEGAGRVVETGDGVSGLRPGDPVVLNWAPACRQCWFCTHGEPYLCEHALDATGRPYATLADGTAVHPGLSTAAFAEQTVLAADACVRLPDDVDLADAALLGCAVLTGVGAVRHAAGVRAGESVVVFGMGGVGLAAVQGARMAGAAPVIAVDPVTEKAALARRLGATDVLLPSDTLAKQVRGLTDGRGADCAIECVGRADTIRAAWSVTRRGGRTVVVGMGARTDTLEFNALELPLFARSLTGCMYGNSDPAVDVPKLLDDHRAGRLDLAGLVTDRIDLDGVPDALARLSAGQGARSLVVFEPSDATAKGE